MPSRLLILDEEARKIDIQLSAWEKTRRTPHRDQKISELLGQKKTLIHRLLSHGKKGNLCKITFRGHEMYFSDIDSEDIDFLMNYYLKEFNYPLNTPYSSEFIPLGKPIQVKSEK